MKDIQVTRTYRNVREWTPWRRNIRTKTWVMTRPIFITGAPFLISLANSLNLRQRKHNIRRYAFLSPNDTLWSKTIYTLNILEMIHKYVRCLIWFPYFFYLLSSFSAVILMMSLLHWRNLYHLYNFFLFFDLPIFFLFLQSLCFITLIQIGGVFIIKKNWLQMRILL